MANMKSGKRKANEDFDEQNESLPSVNTAKSAMPRILEKVQRVYDDWDESARDTYAGGGICHLIADEICDVLGSMGIESTPVSCSMEQHVYVGAKFEEGVYSIDIPYHIYETGGGFTWQKIPDIKFEPNDVVFYKISGDPDEFENYIEVYESLSESITKLNESANKNLTLIDILEVVLPIIMKELKLKELPKIHFIKHVADEIQPTFGRYENKQKEIYLGIENRHPLDIVRTLAHELTHHAQNLRRQLNKYSGETGSPQENEAHAVAGVIMRHINKKYPNFFKAKPIELS
jgi:hypothetical protein